MVRPFFRNPWPILQVAIWQSVGGEIDEVTNILNYIWTEGLQIVESNVSSSRSNNSESGSAGKMELIFVPSFVSPTCQVRGHM
jgi:hypothetical protein